MHLWVGFSNYWLTDYIAEWVRIPNAHKRPLSYDIHPNLGICQAHKEKITELCTNLTEVMLQVNGYNCGFIAKCTDGVGLRRSTHSAFYERFNRAGQAQE